MTMDTQLRAQVVFHLAGRRADTRRHDALPEGLLPALLAPYRRLETLRHDFPALLYPAGDEYADSLSAAVDAALRAVAPAGPPGESMRKRALQVERHLRRGVTAGASGTLRESWAQAVAELGSAAGDAAFEREMAKVAEALPSDGEIVGCDAAFPGRFVRHAWTVVQRDKARLARARIDRLVVRLDDILRADAARSPEAHTPTRLQATFGEAHRTLFDFAAMSRLLRNAGPHAGLPPSRRARIVAVLDLLRSQRFYPGTDGAPDPAEFVFDHTGAALDAFLARWPAMVQLHKALLVAELEADGQYVESLHDPIFAAIDETSLTAADLQFFPDFLVCTNSASGSNVALLEALSAGVPLKVMVQVGDLLERSAAGLGRFAFGLREAQLAQAAMSLEGVFVLQTAASNLLQLRDTVRRGLRHAGPSLFAIYAPPAAAGDTLPVYLAAAAAMQSRAFPAYVHDPGAGADLASRFSLANNPQVHEDWPVESLQYADPDLQSATERVAFTFADFALCDRRYEAHFAVVPRADWDACQVPVAEWLANPPEDASTSVPYVLAVDDSGLLCRVVVDDLLMRAALRCRESWRRLQELAGIHDSRVARALAREREAWAIERASASAGTVGAPVGAAPGVTASEAPARTEDAQATTPPDRDPDEPYVETLRCSSCNECTLAFPKVFAYNDDKQAYIRDLKAATYRQLVEAAESCQVSVIHPGKPRDASEPGLEELIERARPFV
jgi:ferredoxin